MTSKKSNTRDEPTIGISSTTSKKTSTRETRPNPTKKSTKQEREDIAQFLRQRMSTKGSLPSGTINEAAQHFDRHRTTISLIFKELKQKSVHERQRFTTDQERQDIVLFLRQRMEEGGSIPYGTINEAAQHFGRNRRTIAQIYQEFKPKFGKERFITDQERQDISIYLHHRIKAGGSLPRGTINEAAQHFGRHRDTISLIYKKLKTK
jgi:DNA-binding transcriptional regulator YhcF (GntR family)